MEINADVNRDQVEKLVRELMEGEKGKEMKRKAMEWKKKLPAPVVLVAGTSADIHLVQKIETNLRIFLTLSSRIEKLGLFSSPIFSSLLKLGFFIESLRPIISILELVMNNHNSRSLSSASISDQRKERQRRNRRH